MLWHQWMDKSVQLATFQWRIAPAAFTDYWAPTNEQISATCRLPALRCTSNISRLLDTDELKRRCNVALSSGKLLLRIHRLLGIWPKHPRYPGSTRVDFVSRCNCILNLALAKTRNVLWGNTKPDQRAFTRLPNPKVLRRFHRESKTLGFLGTSALGVRTSVRNRVRTLSM